MPYFISPFDDFNPQDFTLIITCADGLENALLIELDSFGLSGQMIKVGRVSVQVSLANFYHICLYSRVASRILLAIGEYHFKQKKESTTQITTNKQGQKITRTLESETLDEDVSAALYEFASRYDWTKIFGVQNTFVIRLSTDKRLNINQQFATLRIKDAIADCFNHQLGIRPNVDAKNPNITIFATASTKMAELFIDLSGMSLHRRGYRVANTAAPLKENLAAALLYECHWHKGEHDAIIDPMCGSGTFISEALLMRANYPVGLEKVGEFGFHHWQHHNKTLWENTVQLASDQFHQNLTQLSHNMPAVIALDADPLSVRACHKNLLAANLTVLLPHIILQERPLAQLKPILATLKAKNPLIITNPPYGERLGESEFIKPLYHGLGLMVKDGLKQAGINKAQMAVLASQIEQADILPITEPKTLRCHNGALTVYFRHGKLSIKDTPTLIENFEKKPITSELAQEFINRLQKNLSHLKKLAKNQNVTNLRIYDADLPNFNVAIDLYGNNVHVQEYAPPKQIPADVAKARFNLVLSTIRDVFGVSREQIFIKTRAKQSGNEQYSKNPNASNHKKMWLTQEDGAYFYVNFTDYLDTGLFIDHRLMRQLVKSASRGKQVLNLFAYTCSASIHAAIAGAKSVTSVDLSANYLDWGKQNFALNGLVLDALCDGEPKYQFIAADVFEWIKNHTKQYDVIFIDPPTFSNSKKFKGTFDVQRDHVALISRAMNRLSVGGVLYFSNNFTRFLLDDSICQRYHVTNITDKTIGFDFDSKKPIHQSFEIRHKHGQNTNTPSKAEQHAFANAQGGLSKTVKSAKSFKSKTRHQTKMGAKPYVSKPIQKDTQKAPTPKVRYQKIDGKMVAIAMTDDSTSDSPSKKYSIKPKNSQ